MKKIVLLIPLVICLFILPAFASALRPTYVYDRANILSQETEDMINNICQSVEENSTAEIVVVTLKDLTEYGGDIDRARETIFNDEQLSGIKGIGKADKDNGVLIVVTVIDSRWGIEVGYGLEGNLTDIECGRIGKDYIKPFLLNESYSDAVINGVTLISNEISGISTEISDDNNEDMNFLIIFLIIIGMVAFIAVVVGGSSSSGSGYHGSSGGSFGSGGFDSGGFGGGGSGGGGASG